MSLKEIYRKWGLLNDNDTGAVKEAPTKPYINDADELILPFESDPKYFWWNEGQSIIDTLNELKAPEEIIKRYSWN